MTKKTVLLITFTLLIASVSAAQDERPLINFRVYGEAVWAPMVYRAEMGGDISHLHDGGAGFGVAASGWNDIGAALGFELTGASPTQSIGFEVQLKPSASNSAVNILNNRANIWIQPLEMLKVYFGLFQWYELQGKIDGIGGMYGYGGGKDDIFQSVDSNIFGALFVLTPPSIVPDPLKGLMLFSNFGISGYFWTNDTMTWAARTPDMAKYIFSTPHLGIAYRHESFGLARFQFIASNYKWGGGNDWAAGSSSTFMGTTSTIHAFYPARVREAAQLELAVNLTSIPNFNFDIGFGFSLPVKVVGNDTTTASTATGVAVGPTFRELNFRLSLPAIDNRRLAENVGDLWQPPFKINAGVTYIPPLSSLFFIFHTRMSFGEQIAFSDGSDNFMGGFKFEAGLGTHYTIANVGTVNFDVSVAAKQNDRFNGRSGLELYNELAVNSINHNGRVDLGLGAYFTRPLGFGSVVIGVGATLPMGGDRYFWSTDEVTAIGGNMLRQEHTDVHRKGNILVIVPIIFTLEF